MSAWLHNIDYYYTILLQENAQLLKCLSSRKVVSRSMLELVYVLYGLSGAKVHSLLLLRVHEPASADNYNFRLLFVLGQLLMWLDHLHWNPS